MGSASATTASVGGRTTWASGSDMTFDGDKMSEDPDDGTSSVGNISDEGNASLVGFGEGASTISGPISRPNLNRISSCGNNSGNGNGGRRTPSSLGSPTMNRNPIAAYLQQQNESPMMPSPLSPAGSSSNAPEQAMEDARMIDGMTYDADVVDTTARTPRLATPYAGEQSQDR